MTVFVQLALAVEVHLGLVVIDGVVSGPHFVTVVVFSGSTGVWVPQYIMHMGPSVTMSRAQESQSVYDVAVWAAILGQQPGGWVMVEVQLGEETG